MLPLTDCGEGLSIGMSKDQKGRRSSGRVGSIILCMLLTLSFVVPEGGYQLAELFFKHFFNYGGVGLVVKGDTF